MNKTLIAFACGFMMLVSPAMAQYGGLPPAPQDDIPNVRTYKVIRVPGKSVVVVNRSPSTCNPPLDFLGKHVSIVEQYSLNNPYRILSPGMSATMDYDPERINFTVDGQGYIRAISCG